MCTINLYKEILEVLDRNRKTLNDILWVGTRIVIAPKEQFLQEAKECDYDNGYGGAIIPSDIIIVGKDWWLSREEYDGSEWWEYNTYPKRPKRRKG